MNIEAEGEDHHASKLDHDIPGSKHEHRRPDEAQAVPGRDLIRLVPESVKASRSIRAFRPSPGLLAATVAIVLGGGFIAGAQLFDGRTAPMAASAQAGPPPETTAQLLHRVENEVHTLKVGLDSLRATAEGAKQDEAIHNLKKSVDVLKQDLEVAKASNTGAVAQLSTKIDKLDRDPTPKLAEISARLERLDHADKEPGPKLAEIAARLDQIKADPSAGKLAEITARLDRIERSVSSPVATSSVSPSAAVAAASAKAGAPAPAKPVVAAAKLPAGPTQSASAEARTPPKLPTVDGWLLRDVYGGVALLEGRAGGLREVAPGQFVPGVGEIRSIERRGRSWVVVTSRGVIEADNRW